MPRDVAGSDEDYGWKTTKISTGGLTFFVRFFRTRGNYNLEVVLKSTTKEASNWTVDAKFVSLDNNGAPIRSIFSPRPISDDNRPLFCLTGSQEALANVWKLDEASNSFVIKYKLKIVKARNE